MLITFLSSWSSSSSSYMHLLSLSLSRDHINFIHFANSTKKELWWCMCIIIISLKCRFSTCNIPITWWWGANANIRVLCVHMKIKQLHKRCTSMHSIISCSLLFCIHIISACLSSPHAKELLSSLHRRYQYRKASSGDIAYMRRW